jgi:hypothetical protein
VVILTSMDILDQRADEIDETVLARDVVVAPTTGEILPYALRYADENSIDGALTFSDDLVEVTARFAADRGLPGQPPEAMPRFRDKYDLRHALAAGGVPVPPFFVLHDPSQVEAALAAVPLPAFLKPTRGSGGALAFTISEPEQLEPVLLESMQRAPRVGGAIERDTSFILEGLLVGETWHDTEGFAPYVSVESVAAQGRIVHLAVTDRFPLSPPALETGMMLPSSLAPEQQDTILDAADKALRALDFRSGLAHTELMLTADGPRVIEVNARAGGALPYLFPMVSNVDLAREAAKVALGQEPVPEAEFTGRAVFVAPQHPVGVEVQRVEGLDEVAVLPGVQAVIPLAVGPGRTENFQQTLIAAVLGMATSPQDATRLWDDVMRTIRPVYREGEIGEHYRRSPKSLSTANGGSGVVYAEPHASRQGETPPVKGNS